MKNWTFEYYNVEKFIEDYNRLYSKLSPVRAKKVDDARTDERKEEELMAGSLLEEMLYDEMGGRCDLEYDISDRGKPFLKNSDLHFSISHTRGIVACAVADRHVGIDVERRGRFNQQVVMKYFTEQELKLMELKPGDAKQCAIAGHCENPENDKDVIRQDLIFTVLWTAKEAVAKCADIPVAEVCKNYDMSHLFDDLLAGAENMKLELQVTDWDRKSHNVLIESDIYDEFAISIATEIFENE